MYSFYGGQKGQDFRITSIFSNRSMDMLQDLQARWYSPINVGDYVFINYGDIAQKEIVTNKNGETDEIETNYIRNLNVDLNACGKSFANSLWQKIYIDENKNISPNFPDSENNVYVFINFEDGFHPIYETDEEGNKIKDKETGEDIVKMYIDNDTGAECTKEGIIKNTNISKRAGYHLKEQDVIYSEENYGFGYRLIACLTGQTPRIQVFHETINIEDGDPYVTLDLTNLERPKIKFYLQRAQTIQEVVSRVVLPPLENPDVSIIKNGTINIDGVDYQASLTEPIMHFELPRAIRYFSGFLFGQGDLSDYPYTMATEQYWSSNKRYTLYGIDAYLTEQLAQVLYNSLEYNDNIENFWTLNVKKFKDNVIKSLSENSDYSYLLPYFRHEENGLLEFLNNPNIQENSMPRNLIPWGSYGLNYNNIFEMSLNDYLKNMGNVLNEIVNKMTSFMEYNTTYSKATYKNIIDPQILRLTITPDNYDKNISFVDFYNYQDDSNNEIKTFFGLPYSMAFSGPIEIIGYRKIYVDENGRVQYDQDSKRIFKIQPDRDNLDALNGYYFNLNSKSMNDNISDRTVYRYNNMRPLLIKDNGDYDYTNAIVTGQQYFYTINDFSWEGIYTDTKDLKAEIISPSIEQLKGTNLKKDDNINITIQYSGQIHYVNDKGFMKTVNIEPFVVNTSITFPFEEYDIIQISPSCSFSSNNEEPDLTDGNNFMNSTITISTVILVEKNKLDIPDEYWQDYGLIQKEQFYSLSTVDEQKQYCLNYIRGLTDKESIVLLTDIVKLISPVMDFKQTLIDIWYCPEETYYFKETYGKYFSTIIQMLTYYGYHLMSVIQDALPGDMYIHTPSGRIYQIADVYNPDSYSPNGYNPEDVNEKYITGRYVGALTAPAPEIDMQLQPAFIKDDKGQYIVNQITIKDNILLSSNALGYKEKFIFEIPKQADFKITSESITHVEHPEVDIKIQDEDYYNVHFKLPRSAEFDITHKTVVNEEGPNVKFKEVNGNEWEVQGEGENVKDVYTLDFDLPRPIHFYTSSFNLNDSILWDEQNKKPINNNSLTIEDDKLSKGDYYLYLGPIKNNPFHPQNLVDENRGEIWQYRGNNVWEKQGSIQGPVGVPQTTKTIIFKRVLDLNPGEIRRVPEDTNLLLQYYEMSYYDELNDIIHLYNINVDGSPNSRYGEAFIFQVAIENQVQESWWGQYYIDDEASAGWSMTLVTGGFILSNDYIENEAQAKNMTYSAYYLNQTIPYWDTDNYY